VAHLALVLGLVVALLPIALMLLRWLPQRVSWCGPLPPLPDPETVWMRTCWR